MAVLMLDTDVFSYFCSRDQRRALPYMPHLKGHTLVVSFVTVGEQYAGYMKQILKGTWNATHLARLEEQAQIFATVPHDVEVCRTYGTICTALMQKQRTVAPNDLWIAASAIRYSLPLVTNNRRHFAAISGHRIIFEAPHPPR